MNEEFCGTCKFWAMTKDPETAHGVCRRVGPTAVVIEAGKSYNVVWPVVDHEDWCGEWTE